jgi:hypothetical protein
MMRLGRVRIGSLLQPLQPPFVMPSFMDGAWLIAPEE